MSQHLVSCHEKGGYVLGGKEASPRGMEIQGPAFPKPAGAILGVLVKGGYGKR